jgi:outer membrane protein
MRICGAEFHDEAAMSESRVIRRIARAAPRGARSRLRFGGLALACACLATGARAETIGGALIKAYLNNPNINQQRAAVRGADEGIPKAYAGYLPTVSANANIAVANTQIGETAAGEGDFLQHPRGYGVQFQQNVWNGNKTFNSIRQAESAVFGQREVLRNTEQTVLLAALTDYMNVLRDTAILQLDRNNVDVLQEQLRQTRDRFNVGEVTRTDVAQAEASLAGAQATALTAQSTLQSDIATYRQDIGDEPRSLAPVSPVSKPLPSTLTEAVAISQVEHPAIVAALHGIDSAELAVKISEGALYPTVGVTGSLTKTIEPIGFGSTQELTAQLMGQVTIPIYQGGAEYATVRQSKESLGQTELQADQQRNQVRAAVVTAWGNNQNSLGILRASKAQVDAAEVALAGVREEAKVGQRTTLDVLNAQQTLLQARVQLVSSQHDQVVNSYTLLSSIGRLSTRALGLAVPEYDPTVHFDQVKNKWIGLRTPDGK